MLKVRVVGVTHTHTHAYKYSHKQLDGKPQISKHGTYTLFTF